MDSAERAIAPGGVRQSEVAREHDRAGMALEGVWKIANVLAERLSPVLRNEVVETERDKEKESEPNTEVGRAFRGHAVTAKKLSDFLNNIVMRLEI
jgi:hypothetical protein